MQPATKVVASAAFAPQPAPSGRLRAHMLAALAAPWVEAKLAKFLKLDGHKIDAAGGKLRLRNVMLRVDAFDYLALPGIALRGGSIGEIEVEVPWTKLKSESGKKEATLGLDLDLASQKIERPFFSSCRQRLC